MTTVGTFGAALAIDDSTGTFSHSDGRSLNPWLLLTFGTDRRVGRVVIHNRVDCCRERLRDIEVTVETEAGVPVWTSATLNASNVMNGPESLEVLVPSPGAVGRLIRIKRKTTGEVPAGTSTDDNRLALTISKIDVFEFTASS